MTGIVVVSHSRALAKAVVDLAQEMVSGSEVAIAYAGGVSGEMDEFGTDATDIMAAIESVSGDDGVLVLVDLGSAILSAEMAMELLDVSSDTVRICPAPLVEGTMAATVAASLGQPLDQLVAEATSALLPKQSQLGGAPEAQQSSAVSAADQAAESETFTIDLKHGLHARPVSKLIRTLAEYDVRAMVSNRTKGRGPVSGASLNQISSLEVTSGDEIVVEASGPDASAALRAVGVLVAERFGETDEEIDDSVGTSTGTGLEVLSPGYALGQVLFLEAARIDVAERHIDDPEAELTRFDEAVLRVERSIADRIRDLQRRKKDSESAIFEAHDAILRDPDLIETTRSSVRERRWAAEYAWSQAVDVVVDRYRALADSYLQMRATDVRDVAAQVLAELDPESARPAGIPDGDASFVVVARELTPSQTFGLDPNRVAAIVTEQSGATSHTAILARAFGIPAVGGYEAIEALRSASLVTVDAFSPEVGVDPDESAINSFRTKRDAWIAERDQLRAVARSAAITTDGVEIDVVANVAGANEAGPAIENGAEGVGLYRTEFLFVDRDRAPSVDEQIEALSAVFAMMGERPVVVRTFDVGGDKQIPYLAVGDEENPFLGVRGIRLYDAFPNVFSDHVEAILRAAVGHKVSVMFPMVSKVEEVQRSREVMAAVHRTLVGRGVAHEWPLPIGIMIETPASVMIADELAAVADFFSIGTNDLTQYVLAAERGSTRLSDFLDSLEPSVLRAIAAISRVGLERGIPVSVCGELGARPEAIPILIGLGIHKISAGGSAIPTVKSVIRTLDSSALRERIPGIVEESASSVDVRQRLSDLA